ncbi:MAG TPA: putative metallopeptidase [Anaeromyxobacteraceae bacterium]|nr:putative metallopeptidase [Anaeromyxobacteraceae bacterium]
MPVRPNMTLAVKRLIRDAARRLPELAHVRASRILVVAGEARRASRATIRPAHFKETGRAHSRGRSKPLVRLKGRKILYVVTLRPLWFLASSPEQRIDTVLHELYHVSSRFDGTLHRGRRHTRLPRGRYDRRIRILRRRYLAAAPAEVVAPFAHRGVVKVRMWLERPAAYRPGDYAGRRVYTERHLFQGLMPMRSPRRRRAGAGH